MRVDLDALFVGDWASDELLERAWRREPDDDCLATPWGDTDSIDAPSGLGGAASSPPPVSAAAAASWWAQPSPARPADDARMAEDEELLVERALLAGFESGARAAMSPLAMTTKQAARSRQVEVKTPLPLSDESGSESTIKARKPRAGRSNSGSSVSSAGSTSNSSSPAVKIEVGASATPGSAKKPRRRSQSKQGKQLKATAAARAVDERDLTPLEIRRKRNRESMQRARRRQRDDIEQMRETLEHLESRYQKLSDDAQARRVSQATGATTNAVATGGESTPRLEADYYALADLSHTLKEEKFLLEQMLTDKQKAYRRFEQVMVDRKQELELPCPTTTSSTSLYSDFDFSPMTEDQANEHIRACYQHIRHVEETAKPFTAGQFAEIEAEAAAAAYGSASPSMHTTPPKGVAEPGCAIPPSATFGWKVMRESTPSGDFLVTFSKFFKAVTAQEAMLNTWSRNSQIRSSPFRRVVRHEVLQVINDSTYIAGVDIEHPVVSNKFMRAINLHFRMQTERGFVIGRYTVNPSSPELRAAMSDNSPFEFVDSCNWVEFATHHDETTGEEGVMVKFVASTEYNTQEDMYVRLVNSISRTMLWENAVMPRPLTLLPS